VTVSGFEDYEPGSGFGCLIQHQQQQVKGGRYRWQKKQGRKTSGGR